MGARPGLNAGSGISKKAETLAHFKKQLDKMLKDLEESPAAKSEISRHRIAAAAYGKFPAAEELAGSYQRVHTRLEELSQILGDQLEALGVTVQLSDRGYDSVDAEQAARLQEIHKRAQNYYDRTDPQRGRSADDDANAAGRDTGKSGTSDSDETFS